MPGAFTYPVAVAVPFDGTEDSEENPVTPPFISINVRDGIIEARNTAEGTKARYAVNSGKTGAVKNSWLEFFDSIGSDLVPFVIPEQSRVKAISISNQEITIGGIIDLYKNGILSHTLNWDGKTYYDNTIDIPLLAGDELSAYIGNTLLKNPIYSIFIQVSDS